MGFSKIPADACAGGTSLGEAPSFVAELAYSPGTALVIRSQSMDQCDRYALIRNRTIWTKPISSTFARPGQPD